MSLNDHQNKTSERKTYLDVLRAAATIAVIISHVSAGNWYRCDIYSNDWYYLNFYNSVSRWGVPVFLMISGVLFLGIDKPIKIMYSKYIKRMVSAFLFWSLIYALIDFSKDMSLKTFFRSFCGGHYHLWYLFAITGIYMIVPFLNRIVSDKTLLRYFLILAFIFAILLPNIIQITYLFSTSAGDFAQGVLNKVNMFFVCGLTIYYIAGYVTDRSDFPKPIYISIYLLGILGFALTVICNVLAAHHKGSVTEIFNSGSSLNVLGESIFVFVLIKELTRTKKHSDRFSKALAVFSEHSFGIYLVHPLLIEGLNNVFHFNVLSFNPILSVPLFCILILFISYILTVLLSKITVFKKFFL